MGDIYGCALFRIIMLHIMYSDTDMVSQLATLVASLPPFSVTERIFELDTDVLESVEQLLIVTLTVLLEDVQVGRQVMQFNLPHVLGSREEGQRRQFKGYQIFQ